VSGFAVIALKVPARRGRTAAASPRPWYNARVSAPRRPAPTDPAPAAARRAVAARAALAALLALGLAAACGDGTPVTFVIVPAPVGHDADEVLDAALVDPDRDGRPLVVVARRGDVALLEHDARAFAVVTPGSGLDAMAPVERLARVHDAAPPDAGPARDDLFVRRPDGVSRWVHSGIGTWSEEPVPPGTPWPDGAPLEAHLDLDDDGRLDRVRARGRRLVVERARAGGGVADVTAAVGLDAFTAPAPIRRVLAGDLDGDGRPDLLVGGGRLFALLHGGGTRIERAAGATATRDGEPPRIAGAAGGARAAPDPARADHGEPAGTPWFVDGTERAGLAFTHVEGDELWFITETMGPGAAFADVDGDGDEDLLVAGGSTQASPLFVNDGAGRFTDEAAARTPVTRGFGMGVSFADWDDDGDPDLYLTRLGPNAMWRNDGGAFVDVTARAGTGDERFGASAAWDDVDRDGDLDLFVTNYLAFSEDAAPPESERSSFRREDPLTMLPYVFPGQPNVLYRNEGDGTFTDATEEAGLLAPGGKSLGALFLDEDDDGWPDLLVANDTTPNTFWHNRDDGTFEENALFVGLDDPRGGMGTEAADLDADGDEELLVTYWQLEPNALYRHNRVHAPTERRFVPRFEDVAVGAGLARDSVGTVGWGCVLADLDNDADDDLFVANGYTSPDYETTMICVGQPDQLFENATPPETLDAHRLVPRFALVDAERAGPPFARALPSRGVAAADVDGDADVDVVVTANNAPLVLYRNERGGRSLRVRVEGRGDCCPRDAPGTRVALTLDDGRVRRAVVRLGASYLSGHEDGVRFGLGDARAERLDVTWPCGRATTLTPGRATTFVAREPATR